MFVHHIYTNPSNIALTEASQFLSHIQAALLLTLEHLHWNYNTKYTTYRKKIAALLQMLELKMPKEKQAEFPYQKFQKDICAFGKERWWTKTL